MTYVNGIMFRYQQNSIVDPPYYSPSSIKQPTRLLRIRYTPIIASGGFHVNDEALFTDRNT